MTKRFLIGGERVKLDALAAMYFTGRFIGLKWMMSNKIVDRQKYATDEITRSYDEIKEKLRHLHKCGRVEFVNFNDLDFYLNYNFPC